MSILDSILFSPSEDEVKKLEAFFNVNKLLNTHDVLVKTETSEEMTKKECASSTQIVS